MKEKLYLEIKLKDEGGADIFITDKNFNALEDQNKLLGQLMFEEPYLVKTILKNVRELQNKKIKFSAPSVFHDYVWNNIEDVLSMNELNALKINFGATPHGDLIETGRLVKTSRTPRPEYREMPSLDSLNYKMEDL